MNNPRLTQPEEMKTRAYVYGVEKLNGYDAWALFQACALHDLPKVKSLLAKDGRLVNAQNWYQFLIPKAVTAGHTEIVKLLLERGADPGQSRYLRLVGQAAAQRQRARASPNRITAPARDAKKI